MARVWTSVTVFAAALLTGTAATAQHYPDMQGPRAYNSGQAYQGGYNEYNRGDWNGRVIAAGPDNGHQNNGKFTADLARDQLGAYGYTHVHGLKREHGWSAHAIKNGRQVKVVLDDEDAVATYTGK